MNLIKSTLANPFKILGVAISASCTYAITPETPYGYDICAGTKIVSFLGVTIQEVTSIFESGAWTIQDDFCDRLEEKSSSKTSSKTK